jgi:hypothetical protein
VIIAKGLAKERHSGSNTPWLKAATDGCSLEEETPQARLKETPYVYEGLDIIVCIAGTTCGNRPTAEVMDEEPDPAVNVSVIPQKASRAYNIYSHAMPLGKWCVP